MDLTNTYSNYNDNNSNDNNNGDTDINAKILTMVMYIFGTVINSLVSCNT